jgi:hypothetical protein
MAAAANASFADISHPGSAAISIIDAAALSANVKKNSSPG